MPSRVRIAAESPVEGEIAPILDDVCPIEARPGLKDKYGMTFARELVRYQRAHHARSDDDDIGVDIAIVECRLVHDLRASPVVTVAVLRSTGADTPAGGGSAVHQPGPPIS